jgi:phytanoyl-CoA hydroxylase
MATAILSPASHSSVFAPLPEHIQANQARVARPQLGWLRPTTADTPLEEMRHRLDQDDYLYVKGLIPRSEVLQMREHYFSEYAGTSLLDPTKPFIDGIFNPSEPASAHKGIGGGDTEGEDLKRLRAAHTTLSYLAFLKNPQLRQMVRDLMGWDEEVLLQRTMLRHNVPGGESTGVHYDKLFLRGGEAFFLTAWVPIGDIKPMGGGLIYLQDSAKLGQAIEDDFTRRAEHFTPEEKISAFNANMTSIGILSNHPQEFEEAHRHIAERAGLAGMEYKWLIANYEAGDVVFHHPCSVHASCSNEDPEGRIRLSSDLRFYDKKDWDAGTCDERWMKVWDIGDGL